VEDVSVGQIEQVKIVQVRKIVQLKKLYQSDQSRVREI